MAKLNNPLLSVRAVGALGKNLIFRHRNDATIVGERPVQRDRKSFAQLQWRHMYQKAVALWHTLSPSEKLSWERQATPHHMTGFAYFMSQALKPNPGLYLPLQGGTMQGQIDMATNKITHLPPPTANEEPTRKTDLSAHAALTTAIHGLKGPVSFSAYQTSDQTLTKATNALIHWHAEHWDIGGYFDITNNRHKPLIAGTYQYITGVQLRNAENGADLILMIRKNGALYLMLSRAIPGGASHPLASGTCIIPMNGSTDYVDVVVMHYNSVNKDTWGAALRTWFQGFLIPQT